MSFALGLGIGTLLAVYWREGAAVALAVAGIYVISVILRDSEGEWPR